MGRQRHRSHDDPDEQISERLALEGQLAGQRLEDDDRQRPEVAPRIDRLDALRLLRAHVVGGAEHRPGLRVAPVDSGSRGLRDAEVEHFGDLAIIVGHEEDVVRLEVAVNDADAVRFRQRPAHLADDPQDVVGRHSADTLQTLAEIFAVEQLHRDVRRALKYAVIEDLDDVGTAKLGRSLCLALEARLRFRQLRDLALDELDGAGDVERQVRGEPDGPHASLTQLPGEPEPLRDHHVGCQLHVSPSKRRAVEERGRRRRNDGRPTLASG